MPFVRVKKCLNCGVAHEWFFEGMTLQELRLIKQITGLRPNDFSEAADDMDPDAIAAMLYVLHRRDKINVLFDDVDLDFKDFEIEATEEELAQIAELEAKMEAAAAEAQAPKVKSGPKPKAASTAK